MSCQTINEGQPCQWHMYRLDISNPLDLLVPTASSTASVLNVTNRKRKTGGAEEE